MIPGELPPLNSSPIAIASSGPRSRRHGRSVSRRRPELDNHRPQTAGTMRERIRRGRRFHEVGSRGGSTPTCRLYDLSGGGRRSLDGIRRWRRPRVAPAASANPSDKRSSGGAALPGLSAAHDLGVLHRDLKPANVMLDGRGVAKITDFGLADFVERIGPHEVAGTPGYMAPEQLTGGPASIKSDIYALGLVLFEIFTGRPAFIPGSAEDRMRVSRDSSPPTPASAQPAIDPTIERLIVRCLDPDPAKRPASARAIAAALPGGGPLAAALAAGETPSPEMVAEGGGVGSLSAPIAWSLVTVVVVSILAIALLNDQAALHRIAPLNLSPDVLSARAKTVLARVGHPTPPLDEIHGFDFDLGYSALLVNTGTAAVWDDVRRGRPALIRFWYRQGPAWLTPWSPTQRPTLTDPPPVDPGSATVVLDPSGRLIRLVVLPSSGQASSATPAAPDWEPMFE